MRRGKGRGGVFGGRQTGLGKGRDGVFGGRQTGLGKGRDGVFGGRQTVVFFMNVFFYAGRILFSNLKDLSLPVPLEEEGVHFR